MAKEIKVPKKLLDFIEKEFKRMIRYQVELDQDREKFLPRLKRIEKARAVRAKRSGKILPERSELLRIRASRGKTKYDLNEFVYMCDHLLVEENKRITKDRRYSYADLNRWISNFLTQRQYKKIDKDGDEKPYTGNDIKRIINKQLNEFSKIGVVDFVEDAYDKLFEKFCNPKKRWSTELVLPEYVVEPTSFQSVMDWNSWWSPYKKPST